MNKPAIPSIDLVELQAKHEQAWRPAYQQFLRLVKARGLTSGVELGVGFGGHCEALLDYRGIDTLVGVDPYTHQPGIDDATNFTQPEMDRLYDRVLHRLARFGRRFELMRDTSRNAARHFEDGSLDFVYIDADHRFDAVADDLGAWFDKVREGGILAGHDYDNPELPDVQQAVDGYFQRLGWTVNHAGDHVWWVQKRRASISYLIPAYNAEETLWQAVASVMEDNFVGGDECIVVDDGSTDATGQVLDELSECYPSLRVIVHDQNYGAAVARNRAVRDANHDLVFMLDADNVLPTDSVAPLRQHLLRHNADAVCCGTIHLFRDGDEPDQTAWTHRYEQTHATLGQYCGMPDPPGAAGNLLFTREAWYRAGGYPEDVGALDAWGFGLRLVATGSSLQVCPNATYDHRIGHDSYWQREVQPGKTDRLALGVLRPYLHRLEPQSQLYLLQGENQERWFTQLAERPLRVEGEAKPRRRPSINLNLGGLRQRLSRLVSRAA